MAGTLSARLRQLEDEKDQWLRDRPVTTASSRADQPWRAGIPWEL
jgi:hypothetical protein